VVDIYKYFFLTQQPFSRLGHLFFFLTFCDQTQLHNTIGSTPLDKGSRGSHLFSRRESNPQSQQGSGRRPTP